MLKGLTESYPHLHIANFVFFMLLHNHGKQGQENIYMILLTLRIVLGIIEIIVKHGILLVFLQILQLHLILILQEVVFGGLHI